MKEIIEGYKEKILPVIGRPGIGQDSIALQIAIEYTRESGKAALIINPKAEDADIRTRVVCLRDRYPYFSAKARKMEPIPQRRFDNALSGLDECGIIIESTRNPSLIEISDKADGIADLGIIVLLDYDKVAEEFTVPLLEMLARRYSVPVIVSALASRELEEREDKHPERADVKLESLAALNTLLLVYRADYYDVDSKDDRGSLTVDKGGEITVIPLKYDKRSFKFTLLP